MSPAGGGTVTPGGYVLAGTNAPIVATANAGYLFSNWTGNVASATNASTTVLMSGPQALSANFASLTPFNSTFSNASPRNGFSGFVGMKLTVVGAPLQIVSVGRVCLAGNSQTHLVTFVNVSDGIAVANASALVNMAGCTPGAFKYAPLPNPINLPVGDSYYFVSQEASDQWYDAGPVTAKSVANITNPVYFSGSWVLSGGANRSYVPPDFLFTGSAPTSTPAFVTAFHLDGAPLRNDFSSFVGMKLTVGAAPLNVTSLGRACLTGNALMHTVKFVLASTGVDVVGASAAVNMAGCTPGQFVYAAPSGGAFTLQPNTAYYAVTQETSGGDQWYDHGMLTTTSDAAVNNSIYFAGSWTGIDGPNTSYVLPNFLYTPGRFRPRRFR